MANLKELKNRRASVQTTKKITQAMNMVAAAKFRKAQTLLLKLRPYSAKLGEILSEYKSRNPLLLHPLLNEGQGTKTLLVIIGADRGLCGSFNNTILKKAYDIDYSDKDVITVGTRIVRVFNKQNLNIVAEYSGFFDDFDITKSRNFVEELIRLFETGQYRKVECLYMGFKNALVQDLEYETLIPLTFNTEGSNDKEYKSDFIYEPSEGIFLNKVLTSYINSHLYRIFYESFTSEQGSRMTAMDSANQNAQDMIETLTLEYNRVRQSIITTELTEIIAGVEAL